MQNKVEEFNKTKRCHEKPMPIYARLLDIQSEVGELAKEFLNNTKYGTKDFDLSDDFLMEFGDVLYALLSLANELKLKAEDCLDMALEKYKKRIDNKNSMASK